MVETIQPNALAIVVTLPVLSTIFVALRAGFRSWTNQFKWDDALCVIAWVLAMASAGVTYQFIVATGTGYHIWDIPERSIGDVVHMYKLKIAQQLLYNPIRCLVKASIIILLLRLGDQRHAIRCALIMIFIFNLGHMVAVFTGVLTQCLPLHMYWNHPWTDQIIDGKVYNPNYTCFDRKVFSLSTTAIGILTDILILIIPILMIWPLRIKLRQKFAVGAVLSLGWIVVAFAIYRFKQFYDYWNGVNHNDPSYTLSPTTSVAEVNIAIIFCCAPAINALVTRLVARPLLSWETSGPGWDITVDAFGYNSPLQYSLPNLTNSRNAIRSFQLIEGNEESQMQIMNNDSPAAWSVDVIRAMNDNDNDGQSLSVHKAQMG